MVRLKFAFAAIIFLLIFGCATQPVQYNDMLRAYEGHNIKEIIESWGDPVKTYVAPNGNKVYVFYMADITTSKDVKYNKFGHYTSVRSNIAKVDVCTTYFETDANGIIVRYSYEGIGCK